MPPKHPEKPFRLRRRWKTLIQNQKNNPPKRTTQPIPSGSIPDGTDQNSRKSITEATNNQKNQKVPCHTETGHPAKFTEVNPNRQQAVGATGAPEKPIRRIDVATDPETRIANAVAPTTTRQKSATPSITEATKSAVTQARRPGVPTDIPKRIQHHTVLKKPPKRFPSNGAIPENRAVRKTRGEPNRSPTL